MLKKDDKVVIHTHRYAELYKDKIFTCTTDEEYVKEIDENVVHLLELKVRRDDIMGKPFPTKFLTKVCE